MKKIFFLASIVFICSISFAQINKSQVDAALVAKGLVPLGNDNYIITSQNTSSNIGVSHVYMRQTINDIEIFNANSSIHFDKNNNAFNFSNGFVKSVSSMLVKTKNPISYTKAIDIVAKQLGLKVNATVNKTDSKANEYTVVDKQASSKDIKAKLYYLYINNQLIQVWNIEFFNDKTSDWWNKRVDVNTGKIVDENNWTVNCDTKKTIKKVKKKDIFSFTFEDEKTINKTTDGSYRVFPFPYESPQKTNHIIVNSTATTLASPFGWHDVDGITGADYTTTRGNNVWAKEDTLNLDDTSGFSPNGGISLLFDYPYNLGANSSANINAAITNLFYWNNTLHDVFYKYGFDEESGNFQKKNYTQRGFEDDFVFADAQDGSGTNNANFGTPPDGGNPRMQMFIWTISSSNNIFNINSPSALKGKYLSSVASFGPYPKKPGVKANLIFAYDASIDSSLCCGTITTDITGKIAVIDRGSCFFVDKVYNAQLAGAIGVIIINNNQTPPFSMSGAGNGKDGLITIPSIMISKSLGDTLKQALLNNEIINASIVDSTSNSPSYADSDFDNGVITHEYTHGVSNRLTGGAINTDCLRNAEQCGEGWSDFFACAFTAHSYDNPDKGRGMGTYLKGEDTTGGGIRDYPYSRNMSINPVTYNSIKTNTEVHYVGFVWCSMLYDILWNMVDKYGFSNDIYNGNGGNNKAIQLVMDGLKLQPCMPGFIDARDAILLADSLNNNFANKDLLWKAFARRGLGYSANQGSAMDATDGIESFDLPPPPVVIGGNTELLNETHIKLYPNPSHGKVNVQIETNIHIQQVEVYDITGKLVYNETLNNPTSIHTIDVSKLETGIYFVNVLTNQGKVCKKLLLNNGLN